MNKHINRILLWFCTGALSLVLVGIIASCDPDAEESSSTGDNRFKNITATYQDVGDDCTSIELNKQYTPKDATELKRLIQRDITKQTPEVNLNYIDTSGITDMSSLFGTKEGATFNGAIHCWDVSKVTTMESMFKGAKVFNQDISGWDIGSVTTMESMFEGAEEFEQNLDGWGERVLLTVGTVSMFAGANKISDIPDWQKADGTRVCFAPSAHANVMKDKAELKAKVDAEITQDTSVNLNHLETCNVTDMSELFKDKAAFDGAINQWDTSKVTTMVSMFENAEAFEQDSPTGENMYY